MFSQVCGTMLATVFVFLGIEDASVYSRQAKRRADVGPATILGSSASSRCVQLRARPTSALTLIPFLLLALYAVKIIVTRDGYPTGEGLRGDLVVAARATIYAAFLIVAAGLKFVLVAFIIYAPPTVLIVMSRREQGRRLFSARTRDLPDRPQSDRLLIAVPRLNARTLTHSWTGRTWMLDHEAQC